MNTMLLALALTFGAPAIKEKPGPEATLIGEWVSESVSSDGGPAESASDRWVFGADGTWAFHDREMKIASGTSTRDPKRSPGTMDLESDGLDMLCRYRLDGDTLVLSVGLDPAARPANVQPAKGAVVWVLKRAKKKD